MDLLVAAPCVVFEPDPFRSHTYPKPMMKPTIAAALMAVTGALTSAVSPSAHAALYSNGFETDTSGWFGTMTRVPSGTGGIPSSSGSYHATASASTPFTQWGGYNYGAGNAIPTAFQEYTTSIDIYLDVGGGWANDTRFDFSSAINNNAGTHRRDFIFNAGFYNDATGPGANTSRFVVSASNNSQPGSAYAKNPGKGPIAISTTGWYTFEHRFYDNGGTLSVDMAIRDASNALISSWTLSDATDTISLIGGNRYGWFDYNQFSTLAFDNAELTVVPEPSTYIAGGFLLLPVIVSAVRRLRRGNTA